MTSRSRFALIAATLLLLLALTPAYVGADCAWCNLSAQICYYDYFGDPYAVGPWYANCNIGEICFGGTCHPTCLGDPCYWA